MKPWSVIRNLLAVVGACVLILAAVAILARRPIADSLTRDLLKDSNIEVRSLHWAEVGGKRNVLEDVSLALAGQRVDIDRISVDRANLLAPKVGQIRVEGARVTVDPARLPELMASLEETPREETESATAPSLPPMDGLDAEINVLVGEREAPLLQLSAKIRPEGGETLNGSINLTGEKSKIALTGNYHLDRGDIAFSSPETTLDLTEVQEKIAVFVPDLLAGMVLSGKVQLTSEGTYVGETAKVSLKSHFDDVRFAYPEYNVELTKVAGRMVGEDVVESGLRTDGLLTIGEARVGTLIGLNTEVTDLRVSPTKITAHNIATHLFGGTLSVADVALDPDTLSATAIVRFSRVDMAELAKLFPGLGAEIVGRADGEIPLVYNGKSLSFGRGWVKMTDNTAATLKLDRPGLITGGMPTNSMAYPILSKVENGILFLKVTTLRAEIFPAAKEGERSATIRIAGVPVDPEVKAPVNLDVNVNGPLDKVISWGMSDSVSFSSGP